ncbi:MAG: phosphate signaling complex protein PhoU [bacterium]
MKGKTVQRHIDKELNKLNTDLLKMAYLTEQAIYRSIEALKNKDTEMALAVIEGDKQIDRLELIIDEMAIDLLALYQPMATDLRFITMAMKINAEIERIADLSVNICQRVLEIADRPLLKPIKEIITLSDIARKMVRDAIDAFVNRDKKLAKEVILTEPSANQLRTSIQRELIYEFLVKDGNTAPQGVPMLLVVRHLERICDHATNIAENIIYMVQAKFVKHTAFPRRNSTGSP